MFAIPTNITEDAAHQGTPLGPIGIYVNGMAIYNQYAGPSQPFTNEINSFDQFNGHPDSTAPYHYYIKPIILPLTKQNLP